MNLDTDLQAEAEQYFATRAARSSLGCALEILARFGRGKPAEPAGELPADLTS